MFIFSFKGDQFIIAGKVGTDESGKLKDELSLKVSAHIKGGRHEKTIKICQPHRLHFDCFKGCQMGKLENQMGKITNPEGAPRVYLDLWIVKNLISNFQPAGPTFKKPNRGCRFKNLHIRVITSSQV